MKTSLYTLKKWSTLSLCAFLLGTTACEHEYGFTDGSEPSVETDAHMAFESPQGPGCAPHFVVQYFDSIEGTRMISVSGASCQPEVEVVVDITMADGWIWEEVRMTMPREEGYFVVSSGGGTVGGFLEDEEPVVCLTVGEDAPICQGEDEVIPWGRG